MLNFFLLKFAKLCSFIFYQTQNIIESRFFKDARCVIWEFPYSEPESIKAFIKLINILFPPNHEALKKLVLLINNGKNGLYEVYIIAAIRKNHWTKFSELLNAIPGVTQTYIFTPQYLLSLAIQGHYHMASENVTPNTVDILYGRK